MRSAPPLLALAALSFAAGCDREADPAAAPPERACRTLSDTPLRLPGGRFEMGSTAVYAEEGPVRTVSVDPFRLDPHEVTNAQFARFVAATGHVTVAEKPVDPSAFSVSIEQVPLEMRQAGSAVFVAPKEPSNNYADWWRYVPGAEWRHPYGPTGPRQRPGEPVVHLAYDDMAAYARWVGGRLLTEAEWEYAARAGGPSPAQQPTEANSWQGVFPVSDEGTDGFKRIAPVGCYEPNAFGLYDMVGNVWEMTSDLYAPGHDPAAPTHNPTGPPVERANDPGNPGFLSRVVKGGSYLCAPNYCRRYRPAARTARDPGLGASNVGFRVAYDLGVTTDVVNR